MSSKAQLVSDVLKNMTVEQIVQARKDGRLDELLAGPEPGAEPFILPEGRAALTKAQGGSSSGAPPSGCKASALTRSSSCTRRASSTTS